MNTDASLEYGYSMTVQLDSLPQHTSILDMGVIRWRLGDGEWHEVEQQLKSD